MFKKLLYIILKKDMVKKLRKKHGEQFVDDVMATFGVPTNLMDKYNNPSKMDGHVRSGACVMDK